MKAYLASKYMSGPKADAILAREPTKKKKKRKATSDIPPSASTSSTTPTGYGAKIVDEDEAGWASLNAKDEDEDMKDAVVASDRGFKKRRVGAAGPGGAGGKGGGEGGDEDSGWATIREPTPPPPVDEEPLVVDTNAASSSETSKPAFRGGLLSAKELAARMAEASGDADVKISKEEAERAQETVYRDTSGRKIDMKAEKAEAARKKREREEREAKKMEWGKGLVQRGEDEERKKELEKMRGKDFTRRRDDEEMNARLKDEDRWNDPMAAFLTVRVYSVLSTPSIWIPGQLLTRPVDVLCAYRKSGQRDHGNLNIRVLHHRRIASVSNLDTDGTESVRTFLLHLIFDRTV